MIRLALTLLGAGAVSVFFFPWPVTALLGIVLAPILPVAPFALGMLADTVYLAPHASLYTLPVFTIAGTVAAIIGLLVRRNLETRIIAP